MTKYIWTLERTGKIAYDECAKMVVVAPNSETARKVAAAHCVIEGPEPWLTGRRAARAKGIESAKIQKVGVAGFITVERQIQDRLLCRDVAWSG
jgi:hypothetical protein